MPVDLDVVYATVGDRALQCDVFRPENQPPDAPAAILLHGGGWRRGSRASMHPHARRLASQGIVAVAAEYRLTEEAPWPAHIHDVKACVRWLRSTAPSLGVHPDRIALVGFSAGAHLSLLAAGTPGSPVFGDTEGDATSEAVNAVVAFFPPVRIQAGTERDNGERPASPASALGDGIGEDEARAASPIEHVAPGYPPTLLLHGTADEVVPSRTSQQFYEAVSAAGSLAELRLYSQMRHEFVRIDEMGELAMADAALFIRRVLVEPERFDIPQMQLFGAPAAQSEETR